MRIAIDIPNTTAQRAYRALQEIEREGKMRHETYPKLIEQGKIKPHAAYTQQEDLRTAYVIIKAVVEATAAPTLFTNLTEEIA